MQELFSVKVHLMSCSRVGRTKPSGPGADGKDTPTFGREVFRHVTANAEESMGKRAGDFNVSRSRGTVTATITLLTAFIGLLIERVCKSISSRHTEEALTQAVVDLHRRILDTDFPVERKQHV
ncbi:hypothetical protein [Paraburkholderia sp. RL17-373-BIF-A]|uniref:hypothetical protein n=1 Tax=Paraburkholderia sp. RL17-373-BIF-A TaxID=3031629 RepID=UPI0038BB50EE